MAATPADLPDGLHGLLLSQAWDTRGCTTFEYDSTAYAVVMNNDDDDAEEFVTNMGAGTVYVDETQGYKVFWGTIP